MSVLNVLNYIYVVIGLIVVVYYLVIIIRNEYVSRYRLKIIRDKNLTDEDKISILNKLPETKVMVRQFWKWRW